MQNRMLSTLYNVWMTFAKAIGFINIRIILSLIFIVLFIPFGFFYRFSKTSMLRPASGKTYWFSCHRRKDRMAEYYRQY